jgi:hypothetical protein
MSAPLSSPGHDEESQEPAAGHREPRTYVTEISMPYFGDGGTRRLHARLKGPEPEPETEPSALGSRRG